MLVILAQIVALSAWIRLDWTAFWLLLWTSNFTLLDHVFTSLAQHATEDISGSSVACFRSKSLASLNLIYNLFTFFPRFYHVRLLFLLEEKVAESLAEFLLANREFTIEFIIDLLIFFVIDPSWNIWSSLLACKFLGHFLCFSALLDDRSCRSPLIVCTSWSTFNFLLHV